MVKEFKAKHELIIDGSRGIYAPQAFVKYIGATTLEAAGVEFDDYVDVSEGPDNVNYFSSWENILSDYNDGDGAIIEQDESGNIFISNHWLFE